MASGKFSNALRAGQDSGDGPGAGGVIENTEGKIIS
jgi:hypothetical protein